MQSKTDSSDVSLEDALEALKRHKEGIKHKKEDSNKYARLVRCVDCMKKKKCKLRVNKHEKKPCKEYEANLRKQSNLIAQGKKV